MTSPSYLTSFRTSYQVRRIIVFVFIAQLITLTTTCADVMELRRWSYPLPPAQSLIDHANTVGTIAKDKSSKLHMPLWALGLGLLAAFAYQHITRVIVLGPIVPVINALAFVGIIVYFYQRVLTVD